MVGIACRQEGSAGRRWPELLCGLGADGRLPEHWADDTQNRTRARSIICVPVLFSPAYPTTIPSMLFEISGHDLSDAEVAAILRDIISGAGRYPRHIELNFTSLCAEHLVDGLRLADLIVIRPAPLRLTE